MLSFSMRRLLTACLLFLVRRRISLKNSLPKVSALQGEDVFRIAIRSVLAQTESILNALPAMVRTNQVDALILDSAQR
jgi:hypothetical protein